MKPWRAIGSTGVVVEMLGAGGKGCLESLKGIFNDMLFQNKLPNNWKLGSLALIYMGKIDPLNKNFYRNIKLLKHSFVRKDSGSQAKGNCRHRQNPVWFYARLKNS